MKVHPNVEKVANDLRPFIGEGETRLGDMNEIFLNRAMYVL
jgi:hypothetical protein